jgi:NAD(P)-dependent dehydrogenase (short-subunit alcohol dehydrogenase family)
MYHVVRNKIHGFRNHQQEIQMNSSSKVVVITGCSSGFGEGAVKAFADKGYRVWGTLRDAHGRNAAKKAALEAYSNLVSVIDMDVTDDDSVAAAFAHILSQGSVDVLINNAGVMYLGITEAFSVAQAKEQMETNYYGAIRAMQAVLPSMRAAKSGLSQVLRTVRSYLIHCADNGSNCSTKNVVIFTNVLNKRSFWESRSDFRSHQLANGVQCYFFYWDGKIVRRFFP